MKSFLLITFFVVVTGQATAQQSNESRWNEWRFLLGKWVAEGGGQPGQASAGGFSFDFDLQGRVRLSDETTPSIRRRGPSHHSQHDDLMVIYQEPEKGTRVEYFDNEGHVIHYSVSFSEDKKPITLVSDLISSAPRFRFIYRQPKDDLFSLEFDIAPPGKPDSFSKYVEGTARRR